MKYMGSKRFLLKNGLGDLITSQLPSARRFVDPFCGAGSVVRYVADQFNGKIVAGDLQEYAVVMAKAIIERTRKIDPERLQTTWINVAKAHLSKSHIYQEAKRTESRYSPNVRRWVLESRALCEKPSRTGPMWNAYGGHYFSPLQAITFDYLLRYLPKRTNDRNVCLAAMVMAATRCAAAPGHTAQPFQPTKTAAKFIKIAWSSDPIEACQKALTELAPLHAGVKGHASVRDAIQLVTEIHKGDLVLIDPPYSGVQYSRFYHVLETIARGKCGKVSGVGRYPSIKERPQSAFSNVSQSKDAFERLIHKLAVKKATVIVTFPKGECSNGLSGDKVIEIAKQWFVIGSSSGIHEHVVTGKFSTMGGNNKKDKHERVKKSRVTSQELLLLLKPKVALR